MTSIEHECDRLWQQIIRAKACNKCRICGGHNVSGHHLIKRRYSKFRWDLDNGYALCIYCHELVERQPFTFDMWMKVNDPEKFEWYVSSSCRIRIIRFTKSDLKEIRDNLKAVYKRYA